MAKDLGLTSQAIAFRAFGTSVFPVETILDMGLGDIFSVRLAGNVTSGCVVGSFEYACSVAGAKLVLVLGHTRCRAVTSTVQCQNAGADISRVIGRVEFFC